jgi:hypothetical protein
MHLIDAFKKQALLNLLDDDFLKLYVRILYKELDKLVYIQIVLLHIVYI